MAATNDNQVLYIEGIGQLLPDDASRKGRSTPLPWGKMTSPADCSEWGVLHNRRIEDMLARRDGDSCCGVYYRILTVYGFAQIAPLRGWLVNHALKAATTAQIGQMIGLRNLPRLARQLRVLEKMGLLIRATPQPPLAEGIAKDGTVRVGPAPTPKTLKGQLGTQQHPGPRAPEQPANDPNDSYANDAPKGAEAAAEGEAQAQGGKVSGQRPDGGRTAAGPPPTDVRLGDGETPKAASAAPSPPSADGYGRPPDPETGSAAPSPSETASAAPRPADQPRADADAQTGAVPTPTADGTPVPPQTQTVNASQSHEQAADAVTAVPAHGPSVDKPIADEPTEADPKARSNSKQRGGMEWHSESFANQIFDVLYPTREVVVIQSRLPKSGPQPPDEFEKREKACFVKGFDQALLLVDQVGAMQLLQRSLKEATAVLRQKPRYTRGQLWRYWFGKHLASMRRGRSGASGPP